ncbi:hypothetical protein KAOT1_14737 [Kordia algicida OT-1]|uniref:Uncharacterized protein n=1 Tax=Kordia algicida OT-1 TaxID=391587 RepID=A9DL56_9FLAO|nr:hypothetical protein KAOT1_14737 [Kordia algicida OT-1]
MKKKNVHSKLNLKKAPIADLTNKKVTGGLAKDTLQRGCASYPYRCSIQECVYTDVTCYHTETCQRPRN